MREVEPITERTEDTANADIRRRLVVKGILPGNETLLVLDAARHVIGRGEECDLRLTRAKVSRKHAEIRKQGPLFMVCDLGSTNGTHVNGESAQQRALSPGTLVRLGEWLGIVEEQVDGDGPDCFAELAPGIWGGALMARVLRPLVRAASSDVPVLLVGRTGTGKERFASALQ